jgi:hypothetical protein
MPTFEHVDIDLISRPSFVAELPLFFQEGRRASSVGRKAVPTVPTVPVSRWAAVQFHYGLW